jgi:ABC-type transport system involved in multi-copper enzyme maturation permease subunit
VAAAEGGREVVAVSAAFARIAWRSLRDLLRLRAFWVALLMPVLFAILFLVLPFAALLLIELSFHRDVPAGQPTRDRVAMVLAPGADPATTAMFDDLSTYLFNDTTPPEGAEQLQEFTDFLQVARRPFPPRDFSSSRAGPAPSKRFGRTLFVEVLEDAPSWKSVAALVPGEYDVALLIKALEPGRAAYRFAWDPGALHSKALRTVVEDRLQRYDRLQRDRSPQRALSMELVDRGEEAPDFSLVRAATLLVWGLLLMSYLTLGFQGAVSLLAGERESRTLEVLLSLPLTLRQVVYAKALALTVATSLPVLFWGALPYLVLKGLGIPIAAPSVAVLALSALALECSLGCAVSASSPSTSVAGNRIGIANLGVGIVGAALLALPGVQPVAMLMRVAAGAPGSPLLVGGTALASLAFSAAALEAGLRVMRRG